jgi:hypothetical protein
MAFVVTFSTQQMGNAIFIVQVCLAIFQLPNLQLQLPSFIILGPLMQQKRRRILAVVTFFASKNPSLYGLQN